MENKLAKSLAYWIDLTPDKNRSFKVRDRKCGGLDFSPENVALECSGACSQMLKEWV